MKKELLLCMLLFITSCSFTGYSTFEDKIITINNASSKATIHIINVTQGDAILVQQQEKSMLIDCGPKKHNITNDLQNLLQEKTIEVLIVTHPDADHMGGCQDIIKNFNIKEVWENGFNKETKTYKEWMYIKKNNHTVKEGDHAQLGDFHIKILNPQKKLLEQSNENSVVIKIQFSNFEGLFTGDCGFQCEKNLMQQPIEADLLKIGHHGSKGSTSTQFLNKVNPQLAVISVGKENQYHHPHKETLERVKEIKVVRTDEQGTIEIILHENGNMEYKK